MDHPKKVVFSPEFERTMDSMSSHLIVTMNFTLRLPHWSATTWLLIGNPQPAKAIPSWKPQVHNVSQLQLPDHLDHSWCCCQHVPLSSQNHQAQLLKSCLGNCSISEKSGKNITGTQCSRKLMKKTSARWTNEPTVSLLERVSSFLETILYSPTYGKIHHSPNTQYMVQSPTFIYHKNSQM